MDFFCNLIYFSLENKEVPWTYLLNQGQKYVTQKELQQNVFILFSSKSYNLIIVFCIKKKNIYIYIMHN